MARTKTNGASGTLIPAEPELPAKRETRGSKRKANHFDDAEENGEGDSASDLDEAPATKPERRSPRKVRKTRAASEVTSEPNSLIVKLKVGNKTSTARNTRNKSAEPTNASRTGNGGGRRRRVATPPDMPSPIEDEGEDEDAENAPAQNTTSTPPSPATPDGYAAYNGSNVTPEQKPKWKEPELIDFRYDMLKQRDHKLDNYKKMEFVMGVDEKYVRDELTVEERKALNGAELNEDTDNPTTLVRNTRGGGRRGRGKGGRGRGGKLMSSREAPEESEVMPTGSGGRGRGGYRVKKSENPRIQSLYHRRAALRHQYRLLANLQRAALEALANKSLDTLKADPEAHARMPEYATVGKGLGEVFDMLISKMDAKHKIYRRYLQERKEHEEEYTKIAKQCAAQAVFDDIEADFMAVAEHISSEYELNDGEGAPRAFILKNKEDGEKQIVRYEKPQKHVAIEATPMFRPGDFPAVVGPNIPTVGDTDVEQHPANYILSDARTRKANEAAVREERMNQKTEKTVKSTKALLGAPTSSSARAPFEALEAGDLDNDSPMDSDAGPVENLDKYGVKLPKKQQPKNGTSPSNRFIVEKHFNYDDFEIGNRGAKYKRQNTGDGQYMGKDPGPNPKSFHFDQVANGVNSALNKPEDLDAEQVKIFGLHPTYGLAVNGCKNLNYAQYAKEFGEEAAANQKVIKPATDWYQPFPPTQPKIFIEEDHGFDPSRITDDRQKRIYRTSRSVYHMRTEQIFQDRPAKDKIQVMLRELWPEYWESRRGEIESAVELISPSPSPVSDGVMERALEEERVSLANIMAAANKLENDEQARIARARPVEPRPKRAFDPVRDISPPPPPPEDRTNLNILASAAGTPRVPMPPPQQQQQLQQPQQPSLPPQTMQTPYMPYTRNWPPQFPWARSHNAPAPSLHHAHPHQMSQGMSTLQNQSQPAIPPLQQHVPHQQIMQQQQMRNQGGGGATGGGSSLRQLLPAPQQQQQQQQQPGQTGSTRYSF